MFKRKSLGIFSLLCWVNAFSLSPSILFPEQEFLVGIYNHQWIRAQMPLLPKPIYWNSRYKASYGINFGYLQTLFHTEKHFSIEFGVNFSNWNIGSDALFALTGLLELRWWIYRTNCFNPYFMYSIAAPTFLSNNHIGGSDLGGNFIFQDYWGLGIMIGNLHHVNIEFKNLHYSNGDLAMRNAGLQIPFLISIAYAW